MEKSTEPIETSAPTENQISITKYLQGARKFAAKGDIIYVTYLELAKNIAKKTGLDISEETRGIEKTGHQNIMTSSLKQARKFALKSERGWVTDLIIAEIHADSLGLDISKEVEEIKTMGTPLMVLHFLKEAMKTQDPLFDGIDIMLAKSWAEKMSIDIQPLVDLIEKSREGKEKRPKANQENSALVASLHH